MPSSQSDLILRMIEQMGAILRRMRARLAGGAPADADTFDELERAQAELFGPLWSMLRSVDIETAVSLIADRRKVEMWVEFLRFEAEAAQSVDDQARADRATHRADALERVLAAG
jgi:hypothetical protein